MQKQWTSTISSKDKKKLEVIEDILFDPNEKILLDYIALPLLNIDKERKEKIYFNDFNNVQKIYQEYNDINKKSQKTDIERKLVDFFLDKINTN